MKSIFLASFFMASAATLSSQVFSDDIPAPLKDVKRIVFLGDSITQGGDYVVDFECWLLKKGIRIEVLNLGLSSETASDLTQAENDPHKKKYGFGRPLLSERLDRVLSASKPDLIFACYGMNDGDNLPADETGTKRFADAITHLREAAFKAGAKKVVICTPPVFDSKNGKSAHEDNLCRYTDWILSKKADGWDVVDIHGPMRKALDERRSKDSSFKFSNDGVHPGREGHWFMASCILTQYLGADLDGISSSEQLFSKNGKEIRELVKSRMSVLFGAWMTKIGTYPSGCSGRPWC